MIKYLTAILMLLSCSSDPGGSSRPADAGSGGEDAGAAGKVTGSPSGAAGQAGSAGDSFAEAEGGTAGGIGSDTGGSGPVICEPGATQLCLCPAPVREGVQACDGDGVRWLSCECDAGGAGGSSSVSPGGWTFDETIQGWAVGWAQTGQTGVEDATLKAGTTLTFDDDSGNPDPGSLLLEIPFTDPEQGVEVGIILPTPIDLSGKIITAKVRLNSGMLSNNLAGAPGGAVLVVKTGEDWVYGGSQWANISDNEWTTITLDVTSPSGIVNEGYDPTAVLQVGILIQNNGVVPEGATVQSASVQIDSVSYD